MRLEVQENQAFKLSPCFQNKIAFSKAIYALLSDSAICLYGLECRGRRERETGEIYLDCAFARGKFLKMSMPFLRLVTPFRVCFNHDSHFLCRFPSPFIFFE
jgi:hypothetical protein